MNIEHLFLIFMLCVLVSYFTRMYILSKKVVLSNYIDKSTKLELSTLQSVVEMQAFQPDKLEPRKSVTLANFLELYNYGYNKSH